MRMTKQHYEFIADVMGPLADKLESNNPKFDRDKFIRRGTDAWEKNYIPPTVEEEYNSD